MKSIQCLIPIIVSGEGRRLKKESEIGIGIGNRSLEVFLPLTQLRETDRKQRMTTKENKAMQCKMEGKMHISKFQLTFDISISISINCITVRLPSSTYRVINEYIINTKYNLLHHITRMEC
jgi:hypothetical protein